MLQMQSSAAAASNESHERRNQEKEEELTPGRRVRIRLPARGEPDKFYTPTYKDPIKKILKRRVDPNDCLSMLRRQEAYVERELAQLGNACKFMKYNADGKPNTRYFYVTPDGTELHWTKTNPNKGRNRQTLTKERPRKRFMADVRGIYYGPANNRRVFRRFLNNKDQFDGQGKDWLCITVAFDDRTLDFVCGKDDQVSRWFMCMQALAPLCASYLTSGSVLWRRLIMKLNFYGLDPEHWPGLPTTTTTTSSSSSSKP
jgi:hypothetical protein